MKQILSILTIFFSANVFAQSVGIGTTTPDATALFDVSSTTKGMLIPRMTAAQRTAIASPAFGLMVYQTDGDRGFYVNNSSLIGTPNWFILTTGKNYWSPSFNFPNDIININSGRTGIGTSNAKAKFHVTAADSATVVVENSQALNNNISNNIYFKNGPTANSFFTGSIKTVGTASNAARMAFSTFASADATDLNENLTILDNGNVGIGNINPTNKLDVAGSFRTSSTAQIGGLLSANNGINVFGSAAINGNIATTGNLQVNGNVRIAGGVPNEGKVLTATDNLGNATWKQQAFTNVERFKFKYNPSTSFNAQTIYNFGTATATVNNSGQLVTFINKSGLYHFDLTGFTSVDGDFSQTGPSPRVGYMQYGVNFEFLHIYAPYIKEGPNNINSYYSVNQSYDVYITAGSSFFIDLEAPLSTNQYQLSIAGYLISE